jgi:hypothetical protein
MDFDNILKSLSDPRETAKMELGKAAKEYMERTLTLLQIIKISQDLYGEAEAEKMTKPYTAALAIMGEHMNDAVVKFNEKHGEI